MLVKHQRQWDVYTASKEAQMINIKPKCKLLKGWLWYELLAMGFGILVGLVLAINAMLLPILVTWLMW